MIKKEILLGSVLMFGVVGFAITLPISVSAEEVSTSCSVPLAKTSWTKPCLISQFDPSLGNLESVRINTNIYMEYDAKVEFMNTTPGDLSFTIDNYLRVDYANGSELVNLIMPTVSETLSFPSYDGSLDFNGASGRTYDGVTLDTADGVVYDRWNDSVSDSSLVDSSIISDFSGNGDYVFSVNTAGTGGFESGNNFVGGVDTYASADIEVIYTYTPFDPEPEPQPEPDPIPEENEDEEVEEIQIPVVPEPVEEVKSVEEVIVSDSVADPVIVLDENDKVEAFSQELPSIPRSGGADGLFVVPALIIGLFGFVSFDLFKTER